MILPTSVSEPQKVKGFRLLFPRLARRSAAYRPNSIRRVLSGCSSNPTAQELKAHYDFIFQRRDAKRPLPSN